MKVKTTMRQMKEAKVAFISLVTRGANRIPFRVLKSDKGEDNMLDLTQLRHVFKGDAPAQSRPSGLGFAEILRGGKPAPQTVATTAPVLQSIAKTAPVQSIAEPTQPQQRQQVEERQRQGLAPNQPQSAASAPRRAANTPKVPAKPSRDTVTLKELRGEIDNALARRQKEDAQEQFNAKRSAFAQIAPTRQDQVPQGGRGDAWSLRNHGAQLAVQLLGGTDKPLPANTAFRPFSAAGTQA
jgi:hypothetical protein